MERLKGAARALPFPLLFELRAGGEAMVSSGSGVCECWCPGRREMVSRRMEDPRSSCRKEREREASQWR